MYPQIKQFFKKPDVLLVLIFLTAIIKSGVWVMGNLETTRLIAENPFVNPFDNSDADYLINSWLLNFIAYSVRATNPINYLALHIFFTILAILVGVVSVKRRMQIENNNYASYMFVMLPVSAGIFYWVGMDGFLFLLLILYFAIKRKKLTVVLGILVGMQHFEIGIIAVTSLIFYDALTKKNTLHGLIRARPTYFALGMVLGKLTLITLFNVNNLIVRESRYSLGFDNVIHNLVDNVRYLPAAVFSAIGIFWILVLKLERNKQKAFLISFLIPVVASLFVWDQTRILQQSSILIVMRAFVLNKNLATGINREEIKYFFFAWLIIPWVWVWQDFLGPITGYNIMILVSRIFNTDTAPVNSELFWWIFSRNLL